jgi:hypothetical protein
MHLIVFCDGTWNTPDQMDDGVVAPTNVVKLYNAVAEEDADGKEQRCYYHTGVGTEGGVLDRLAGGGMGEGLEKNIKSAYHWLSCNYEPGAKIWLFGFSRGAYTVRSISGMISRCGLLNGRDSNLLEAGIWAAVDTLFGNYRQPKEKAKPVVAAKEMPFHECNEGEPCADSIPLYFVGVWDTVGALGVPDDLALLNVIDDPAKHAFHDTKLSKKVAHARHALAIDERRDTFTPTLWTDVEAGQDVKQVWFPGVHSDVGGGYGRSNLSDGALKWMMDEAAACGMRLTPNVAKQLTPDPLGFLHDSVTGAFKLLTTRPRAVPLFASGSSELHDSALHRHQNPSLTQGGYWKTRILSPGQSRVVDIYAREPWNHTGIYLEAGVTYRFSAQGEWVDGSIKCGPAGADDGKFHLGEIVQMASSAWGKVEKLFVKMTGNKRADFW